VASDAQRRALEKLLALHTVPSSVAFSPAGRFVVRGLCGFGTPGHVALTFDDGPDPHGTPAVVDALERFGWQATFFLVGDMVRRAPGLVTDLVAAGHEVGVHAETHRSQRSMTPRQIGDDIRRAYAEITGAAGVCPRWYRPPHGALSPEGLLTARDLGMRAVLWSAWGRDWLAEATPETVRRDVAAGRLDGGTVLLHDSDCASAPGSWRTTVAALPLLAELFEARRLTVGPLRDHATPVPAVARS